jgi:soluble lytic murein transglycosylase-like protein
MRGISVKVKIVIVAGLSAIIVVILVLKMLPSPTRVDKISAQVVQRVDDMPKIHLEDKSFALDSNSVKQLTLIRDPFEVPTDLKKQYDDQQAKYAIAQASKPQPPTSPVVTPDPNGNLPIDNGSGLNGQPISSSGSISRKSTISQDLINATMEGIAYEYRVDPLFVKAIISAESNYDEFAINYNDNGTIDRGLMQINSGTAPGIATALGMNYNKGIEFDYETNLKMGIYQLNLLRKTNSSMEYILTAYNLGINGAKDFYIANKSYASDYSTKVLKKYDELVNS